MECALTDHQEAADEAASSLPSSSGWTCSCCLLLLLLYRVFDFGSGRQSELSLLLILALLKRNCAIQIVGRRRLQRSVQTPRSSGTSQSQGSRGLCPKALGFSHAGPQLPSCMRMMARAGAE